MYTVSNGRTSTKCGFGKGGRTTLIIRVVMSFLGGNVIIIVVVVQTTICIGVAVEPMINVYVYYILLRGDDRVVIGNESTGRYRSRLKRRKRETMINESMNDHHFGFISIVDDVHHDEKC